MLKSVPRTEDAVSLVHEMTNLLRHGGFRLTKWLSTHREVLDTIPDDERAKSLQTIDISDSSLPQESALGLQWNTEQDAFMYDVCLPEKPSTKRGLLSITSSLYDPLGFVSPVLLVPKLIQQELCRQQLDWDDAVPPDLATQVCKWLDSVDELQSLRISRCFKPKSSTQERIEFHCFSDASEAAYGAAVYIKVITDSETSVSLVMGKSRVAPLKTLSIPRLELTAAVVATKLHKFVVEEADVKPDASYFWTDSMTVLKYLENTSTRYKTFVAHRIQTIHESTNLGQWNYVPTALNPADHASRGVLPREQHKLRLWLDGPEFLKEPGSDYKDKFTAPNQELELELKSAMSVKVVNVIDDLLKRHSSYHRMCKAVAWVRKFGDHLQGKAVDNYVTIRDIQNAETAVWRYQQQQAFPQEIKALSSSNPVSSDSNLGSLDPVISEDGILRVGGRLKKTTAAIEKHPVIIPTGHVAELLIRELHERNAHAGVNHTLTLLRRKFYLPRGYKTVRDVIRRCVACKRHHGKTSEQKMADLPKARLEVDLPPFTNVGIDYFGPVLVKSRRCTVKRWGCVFTCLVTRAVHIEVAHEMSADSFLMAFHRFVARRGKPRVVYSDNGTNFVAADKELKNEIQAINGNRIDQDMLLEAIEWHFNPPHAPHMGGVWERIIQSVKSTLRVLITDRLLTDEELLSFLAEVEKVLNDRPLTRMGSDPNDATPITPNDILLLRRNDCSSSVSENHGIRKRWATVQELANKFYERFESEYLPTLQARAKWTQERPSLREGDIVLVAETEAKRGQWPLGLVVETLNSHDGRVRSAKVKVGNSIRTRPVDKLVFLEHHE